MAYLTFTGYKTEDYLFDIYKTDTQFNGNSVVYIIFVADFKDNGDISNYNIIDIGETDNLNELINNTNKQDYLNKMNANAIGVYQCGDYKFRKYIVETLTTLYKSKFI